MPVPPERMSNNYATAWYRKKSVRGWIKLGLPRYYVYEIIRNLLHENEGNMKKI